MNHYTEEELILHYYDESDHSEAIAAHLASCETCTSTLARLERDLGEIRELPFPNPGPGYSREVWDAIQPKLEATPAPSASRRWRVPMAAAAGILLAFASLWIGFRMGRNGGGGTIDPEIRRQALRAAVSMHFQSSERLLMDLSNVDRRRSVDLAAPARRASDLASTNRLYRRTAELHGDAELSALLDELERLLLDIANAPEQLSPVEFNALWSRVERSGLLLKMRLKETEVREQRASSQV